MSNTNDNPPDVAAIAARVEAYLAAENDFGIPEAQYDRLAHLLAGHTRALLAENARLREEWATATNLLRSLQWDYCQQAARTAEEDQEVYDYLERSNALDNPVSAHTESEAHDAAS